MRIAAGLMFVLFMLLGEIPAAWRSACAEAAVGRDAPRFFLADLDGRVHNLSQMKDQPLLLLYFFDPGSETSRDGLISLGEISKRYKQAGVVVWAVTAAPADQVRSLPAVESLPFPILLDTSGVSELYQAGVVLPAGFVVESGSMIVFRFEGAGKSAELKLERFLEQSPAAAAAARADSFEALRGQAMQAIERRQYNAAIQLSEKALSMKKDPDVYLSLVKALAALKEDYRAEKAINEALVNFPRDPRFHETHVRFLLSAGRSLEAGSALDRALQVNPGDPALEALLKSIPPRHDSSSVSSPVARVPPRQASADQVDPETPPNVAGIPSPLVKKTHEERDRKARDLFDLASRENPRLKWDDCLARKARQRAADMVERKYFSHKDPKTGKNPAWELVNSCYECKYAGENLSRGHESARIIHRAWMKSSAHRENILNTRFSILGVACHEDICVGLFAGL